MARTITVAALQTSYGEDMAANIRKTEGLIREAAGKGAQAILPSELFQGHYFCVAQEEKWFATAYPWREHPCVTALAPLAGELGVVIPISIYEREGPHYYNSIVIADADGSLAGLYRKSHIPDGPGYQEKYYFRPGDTGFKVWDTRFGKLGVVTSGLREDPIRRRRKAFALNQFVETRQQVQQCVGQRSRRNTVRRRLHPGSVDRLADAGCPRRAVLKFALDIGQNTAEDPRRDRPRTALFRHHARDRGPGMQSLHGIRAAIPYQGPSRRAQ